MEEASHPKQLPLLPAGSNAATSLGFLMVVSRMLTRHQHEPRARLRSATSGTMKRKGAAARTGQHRFRNARFTAGFANPFLNVFVPRSFISTFRVFLLPSFLRLVYFSPTRGGPTFPLLTIERTRLQIPCPRESRP